MTIVLVVTGVIVLVIFIIILLYAARTTTTHLVSQDERLVIYRLGSFSRLAGPGAVQTIPGIDDVVGTVSLSEFPVEVTIADCSAFGLSADLTLKFWCKFDLGAAAKNGHKTLADLVKMSDTERNQQIKIWAREALVRQIAHLQERIPLPDRVEKEKRVAALAPGSLRYNTLVQSVINDLEQKLLTLGIIVSTTHQSVLTFETEEAARPADASAKEGQESLEADTPSKDRAPQGELQPSLRLTRRDLMVLKRVPRQKLDKRFSA